MSPPWWLRDRRRRSLLPALLERLGAPPHRTHWAASPGWRPTAHPARGRGSSSGGTAPPQCPPGQGRACRARRGQARFRRIELATSRRHCMRAWRVGGHALCTASTRGVVLVFTVPWSPASRGSQLSSSAIVKVNIVAEASQLRQATGCVSINHSGRGASLPGSRHLSYPGGRPWSIPGGTRSSGLIVPSSPTVDSSLQLVGNPVALLQPVVVRRVAASLVFRQHPSGRRGSGSIQLTPFPILFRNPLLQAMPVLSSTLAPALRVEQVVANVLSLIKLYLMGRECF